MDTLESVAQAVELMRVAYASGWRFWIGRAKKEKARCDLHQLLRTAPQLVPELMDAVYASEFAEAGMELLREVVSGATDEARRVMDEAGEECEHAHVWRVLESDSEATLFRCCQALRSPHRSIRSAVAEGLRGRCGHLDDTGEQEEFMSALEAALRLGGARHLPEILQDLSTNQAAIWDLEVQMKAAAARLEAERLGRSLEEQVDAHNAVISSVPEGPLCARAQETIRKISAGEYGPAPKEDLRDLLSRQEMTRKAMAGAEAILRAQGR